MAIIVGLVFIIPFGIILLIIALLSESRDPNLWYGRMLCDRCNYRWNSRKTTKPSRCPSYNKREIRQILG